jgi:hypothetical protein
MNKQQEELITYELTANAAREITNNSRINLINKSIKEAALIGNNIIELTYKLTEYEELYYSKLGYKINNNLPKDNLIYCVSISW